MKAIMLVMMASLLLGGCAVMNEQNRNNYREIESIGAPCREVAVPTTAALLNILPGGGDLYLAGGDGANPKSWGAFVLDFLLWPISVIWAIPQGSITAQEVNKIECVGYYTQTEKGKEELRRLKAKQREEIRTE